MKAMILAAGTGTRLHPLTDSKPKALVELAGKTMLEWTIEKLKGSGITEVVVNIHHFPDQIVNFLEKKNNFGIHMEISDETDELLDSGGAILKARKFLEGGSFLVHNVDIISDIKLNHLIENHFRTRALVSLAVRRRMTSRYLLFDEDLRLRAWQNLQSGQYSGLSPDPDHPLVPLAFSGISLYSPEIFDLTTEKGGFPVMELLLRLAPQHEIQAFIHDDGYWFDLGTQANLEKASSFLNSI